eukprot:scaffold111849_cov66-Phaeocystis_antarctica.AAC.4
MGRARPRGVWTATLGRARGRVLCASASQLLAVCLSTKLSVRLSQRGGGGEALRRADDGL